MVNINSFGAKFQTKFVVCIFNKLSLGKNLICEFENLNVKQRRSRWDGSLWAVSSGSMLFVKAYYYRMLQWKCGLETAAIISYDTELKNAGVQNYMRKKSRSVSMTQMPPPRAILTHMQAFCKKWSWKKGHNSHNNWQILPQIELDHILWLYTCV